MVHSFIRPTRKSARLFLVGIFERQEITIKSSNPLGPESGHCVVTESSKNALRWVKHSLPNGMQQHVKKQIGHLSDIIFQMWIILAKIPSSFVFSKINKIYLLSNKQCSDYFKNRLLFHASFCTLILILFNFFIHVSLQYRSLEIKLIIMSTVYKAYLFGTDN